MRGVSTRIFIAPEFFLLFRDQNLGGRPHTLEVDQSLSQLPVPDLVDLGCGVGYEAVALLAISTHAGQALIHITLGLKRLIEDEG